MDNYFIILIGFLISSLSIAGAYVMSAFKDRVDKSDLSKNRTDSKLIHRAITKAQDILVSAELQGIKSVAQSKLATGRIEEQYQKELSNHIERILLRLDQNVILLQKQYQETLKKLQHDLEDKSTRYLMHAEENINHMSKKHETSLLEFTTATQEELNKHIQAQMKSIEMQLSNYEKNRKDFIDEEMLYIVEQAVAITLATTLSAKEHADLVYKALAKAKESGFFTTTGNNHE